MPTLDAGVGQVLVGGWGTGLEKNEGHREAGGACVDVSSPAAPGPDLPPEATPKVEDGGGWRPRW